MPNFTKFNQAFNPADVQEFFHYDEAEDKSIIYKTPRCGTYFKYE